MAPTLFRSRAFLILLISFIFFSLLVFRHPDTILKSIPSRIYALSPYSASAFSGCPDIHAAGSLPPINHHAQTCSPVVSASDDFSLSVCHDPTTCNAFTLHIIRSDPTTCAEVEATRILSSDPELDEWIRTKLGPDSFEILTNGAERMHSALATYEGGCKWRFDIQLWNAGRFWVNVWHTYEVLHNSLSLSVISHEHEADEGFLEVICRIRREELVLARYAPSTPPPRISRDVHLLILL
jgi:hypothetical protein